MSPKPLLRVDTADPVVAGKLIDFLASLEVGDPESALTLIRIDPEQTEAEFVDSLKAVSERLREYEAEAIGERLNPARIDEGSGGEA